MFQELSRSEFLVKKRATALVVDCLQGDQMSSEKKSPNLVL
jgi:hypothetical protein